MDTSLVIAVGGIAVALGAAGAIGRRGPVRARGGATVSRLSAAIDADILADPRFLLTESTEHDPPPMTIEEFHRRWGH